MFMLLQNLIHLKMKYFIKRSLIQSLILCCTLFFFACGESEGPTVPDTGGNPLAGAYVLYGTAGSTDYAYYDAVKDSVTDYVFTSSNPGRSLNINPGEIKLNSDKKAVYNGAWNARRKRNNLQDRSNWQ